MSSTQSQEEIDNVLRICKEIRDEEDREELWRWYLKQTDEAMDNYFPELEDEECPSCGMPVFTCECTLLEELIDE